MSDRSQLSDLIPNNIFIGTSSIIRRGERFLYGIRPPKQGEDFTVFELTGIGGSLEKFDESYSAGILREAQEEIGCQIHIVPAEQVLETARRDLPLHELLAAGAELVAGPQGRPPLDGLARMTDSQEALALALGDQTPTVYWSLGSQA